MSNYRLAFFVFLLLCLNFFSASGQSFSSNPATQKLLRADVFFEREDWESARIAYRELFESGYFTEETLYRLAYTHEKKADWAEAIYYLQKARITYGNPRTSFHIQQLGEKMDRPVSGIALQMPLHEEWLKKNQTRLQIAQLLGLLISLAFFFIKRKKMFMAMGLATLGLSILVGGALFYVDFWQPERGVLIRAGNFHQQAGYASSTLSVPLSPGQLVEIKDRHDIWLKVSLGRHEAWVPQMDVRAL